MKEKYVIGFMFSENQTELALIRKTKPYWQAGLLNGIGGKVEVTESFKGAMVREFEEETGCLHPHDKWLNVIIMTTPEYEMRCYVSTCDLSCLETTTEERIEIHKLQDLMNLSLVEDANILILKSLKKLIHGF